MKINYDLKFKEELTKIKVIEFKKNYSTGAWRGIIELNQKYRILFWLSICFPYNINYFLFYTNKSPFVRGYLRSLFKTIFRCFGDA